jgi:hypothetical protein
MKRFNLKKVVGYAVIVASCLSIFTVGAAKLTAKEIVIESEARYSGEDMVSILAMTLTNKQGKQRRRQMLWYHSEEKGLSKDMQKFYYPRSIKNVATLYEEVVGKDARQFLYLPAARKLRRVSSKNKSWVGSDLIYEDLQNIDIDDWQYRDMGHEQIDGFDTHVIEMTATAKSDSSYSKRHYYVRSDGSFYPSKVRFFDKSGKLLKELERTDVRDHQGALYADTIKVHNMQDGHSTELKRRWIKVNVGLSQKWMSRRQMKKSIENFQQPKGILQLALSFEGQAKL